MQELVLEELLVSAVLKMGVVDPALPDAFVREAVGVLEQQKSDDKTGLDLPPVFSSNAASVASSPPMPPQNHASAGTQNQNDCKVLPALQLISCNLEINQIRKTDSSSVA